MPGRNWTRKSIEEMIDAYLKKRLKGGGNINLGELGGIVEIQPSRDFGPYTRYGEIQPFLGEVMYNKNAEYTLAKTWVDEYYSPNHSSKTLINDYLKRTLDKTLPIHDISPNHDRTGEPPAYLSFATFVDGNKRDPNSDHIIYNIWYGKLLNETASVFDRYKNELLTYYPNTQDYAPYYRRANGYTVAFLDRYYSTHNRYTDNSWDSGGGPYAKSNIWNSTGYFAVKVYMGLNVEGQTKLYRLRMIDGDTTRLITPRISRRGPYAHNSDLQCGVCSYYVDITDYLPEPHQFYPDYTIHDYNGFANLTGYIDLPMQQSGTILRRNDILRNSLYYFMTSAYLNDLYNSYLQDNRSEVKAYFLMLSEPSKTETIEGVTKYSSCLSDQEILNIYNYVFNRDKTLYPYSSDTRQSIQFRTEIEDLNITFAQLEDQLQWWNLR